MLILNGAVALSASRKAKLLSELANAAELASLESRIGDIDAQFVYFVELISPISDTEQQKKLAAILEGEQVLLQNIDANQVLITPRVGTISPWSSKATEILQRCGLSEVERVERGILYKFPDLESLSPELSEHLFDRMTESKITDVSLLQSLFSHDSPSPMSGLTVLDDGLEAMKQVDRELGLALAEDEILYLLDCYAELGREPTDVELMMFAQANSEHCRHKIFNASWTIDGVDEARSLFSMIRNTHELGGEGVLSAYSDNAAVVEGSVTDRLYVDGESGKYSFSNEPVHLLMKVETHNHPTAISPFAGAGTGSGGEIRDEGAVGRGSKPKAGLCGFSVSNLRIPGFVQPWEEEEYGKPGRIVDARTIMLEGPIGAAAFNNEFGRPNLCGYFRSFEMDHQGH
ncbi:MAG: phosphoribosylformylglycinamidine synthase, partial [Porticoccaceae bacterium]|nr:phosphoribosylformylglycinamidine synthase [Porticoccaceae bacterium]